MATQFALRAKLDTLEVLTTGSASLSATATGYARSSGSFVTDGFRRGMEILASGFGTSDNNGRGVVTHVTALALTVTAYDVDEVDGKLSTVARTLAVESEGAGREISVPRPGLMAWENIPIRPTRGVPYTEEQYLPGPPPRQITLGPLGELEIEPMYNVQVHVPENTGFEAAAKYADALATLFAPRTEITVGSDVARVRPETGPFRGQLRRSEPGWVVVPITFPLRLRTPNSI